MKRAKSCDKVRHCNTSTSTTSMKWIQLLASDSQLSPQRNHGRVKHCSQHQHTTANTYLLHNILKILAGTQSFMLEQLSNLWNVLPRVKEIKKKKKGKFTVTCFLKISFCQCFVIWNKNASEKQKTQIISKCSKHTMSLRQTNPGVTKSKYMGSLKHVAVWRE